MLNICLLLFKSSLISLCFLLISSSSTSSKVTIGSPNFFQTSLGFPAYTTNAPNNVHTPTAYAIPARFFQIYFLSLKLLKIRWKKFVIVTVFNWEAELNCLNWCYFPCKSMPLFLWNKQTHTITFVIGYWANEEGWVVRAVSMDPKVDPTYNAFFWTGSI